MILNTIDILNFKNIAEARLEFSPGVNCLLGMNGMGKSNLLEAIHFLSLTRPMHSIPESALILHGCDMLMVKGVFDADSGSVHEVSCGITRGKGKSVRCDGKEYERISEHIGRFPVVAVTPADSDIVTGAAQERRRLLDMVISQASPAYITALMRYNRALDSRNKMLRAGVRDTLIYESIEASMTDAANIINRTRAEWITEITPAFQNFYTAISGDAEKVKIGYTSVLNDTPFADLLKANFQKDLILGYTSNGIHRDDISMELNGYSLRRLGSQGQIKTFTIALRFAIFEYLRSRRHITPILLLDDIFDKLDSGRVERIMKTVSTGNGFGQIFITDTNREHLDETISALPAGEAAASRLFEVRDGSFFLIDHNEP